MERTGEVGENTELHFWGASVGAFPGQQRSNVDVHRRVRAFLDDDRDEPLVGEFATHGVSGVGRHLGTLPFDAGAVRRDRLIGERFQVVVACLGGHYSTASSMRATSPMAVTPPSIRPRA